MEPETPKLPSTNNAKTANQAARILMAAIHKAAKTHGGRVLLKDSSDGVVVFWDGGPAQWADSYAANPANVPDNVTMHTEGGDKVIFKNLS